MELNAIEVAQFNNFGFDQALCTMTAIWIDICKIWSYAPTLSKLTKWYTSSYKWWNFNGDIFINCYNSPTDRWHQRICCNIRCLMPGFNYLTGGRRNFHRTASVPTTLYYNVVVYCHKKLFYSFTTYQASSLCFLWLNEDTGREECTETQRKSYSNKWFP